MPNSTPVLGCNIRWLEGGRVLFSSQVQSLEFDEGVASVVVQHDDYSTTSYDDESITASMTHDGIVGQLDLGFSKHVFVITKKESCWNGSGIVVYRVVRVKPVCVWRKPFLTLDEDEFESVTLRNLVSQLTTGDTFFSFDIDLTNGLQYMATQGFRTESESINFDHIDERFFWNKPLLGNLLENRTQPFIVPLICGHVGSVSLSGTQIPIKLVILSRVSRFRAGTRYWTRGVDQTGDVALEVETDILCISKEKTASFRILRGSIPLLWSQPSVGLGFKPAIDTNLAESEISVRSLQLHFERLLNIYGKGITALDLIDRFENQGHAYQLSKAFEDALKKWNHAFISYENLPPARDKKSTQSLKKKMDQFVKNNGFFLCNNRTALHRFEVIMKQIGIIRVNDLDCVDDTTVAQFAIAQIAIKTMLFELGTVRELSKNDWTEIEKIWIEMSDKIAYYYLGSPSFVSHLIRPSFFKMIASGPSKMSINFIRYYMSRFQDYGRQDNIDTLMGIIISEGKDTVREQLQLRRRIIHSDLSNHWPLTLLLIVKRFTAPRSIKTAVQFILSILWTIIYLFMLFIVGVDQTLFIRTPHHDPQTQS